MSSRHVGATARSVVDLAFALWVFRALNGEGQPAIRAELSACVLLPGREAASLLVGLGLGGIAVYDALGNDDRRLKMQADGRLEPNPDPRAGL
jgi:hypothetical protein